jgi:hypothetical protein
MGENAIRLGAGRLLNRRSILKSAGLGCLMLGSAGLITSCEAAAFSPAILDWLSQLGTSIAATEIENIAEGGLKAAWQKWGPGVEAAIANQPSSYGYDYPNGWVHPKPPVALVGVSRTKSYDAGVDPYTDRLLACVEGGRKVVVFEAWAWQTLSSFVNSFTNGLTGDDLAHAQDLCVSGVIPCATRQKTQTGESPEGTVGWMTYNTLLGYVEISWAIQSDNTYNGTLTATGILDANGNPTVKSFPLPSQDGTSNSL